MLKTVSPEALALAVRAVHGGDTLLTTMAGMRAAG